jgi:hypothetical protein
VTHSEKFGAPSSNIETVQIRTLIDKLVSFLALKPDSARESANPASRISSGHKFRCPNPNCRKLMVLWDEEFAAHKYCCPHCGSCGRVAEWPSSRPHSPSHAPAPVEDAEVITQRIATERRAEARMRRAERAAKKSAELDAAKREAAEKQCNKEGYLKRLDKIARRTPSDRPKSGPQAPPVTKRLIIRGGGIETNRRRH